MLYNGIRLCLISFFVKYIHGFSPNDIKGHLMKEIDFPFSSYVTPRDGLYNISEECRIAGDEYLLQIGWYCQTSRPVQLFVISVLWAIM